MKCLKFSAFLAFPKGCDSSLNIPAQRHLRNGAAVLWEGRRKLSAQGSQSIWEDDREALDRHTERERDRQTDRQTHTHERVEGAREGAWSRGEFAAPWFPAQPG